MTNPYESSANAPLRSAGTHTFGVSIRADAYRGAKVGSRYFAIVGAGLAFLVSLLFIVLPLLHALATGGTTPTLLQVVLPFAFCIVAVVVMWSTGGALGAMIASTAGIICRLRHDSTYWRAS